MYFDILPVKTPRTMPLQVREEIFHCNELNDKMVNAAMNLWEIARNGMELILFHPFHGQRHSTILA
jgi:hypothetical protein